MAENDAVTEENAIAATAPSAPSQKIVEMMLDRPVAEMANFVSRSIVFLFRATLTPWRVGREIADGSPHLPPPYAWLVVSVFLVSVLALSMNSVFSDEIAHVLDSDEKLWSLLSEISLASVVLETLPTVLLLVLSAKLVSYLLGGEKRKTTDPLIAATCYTVGWQCIFAVGIALAGRVYSLVTGGELFGVSAALLAVLAWGAWLMAPAFSRRLPGRRWFKSSGGFAGAVVMSAPLLFAAILNIEMKMAYEAPESAQQVVDAKRKRFGDLEINLLQAVRDDLADEDSSRCRFNLSFTNHSHNQIVVPWNPILWPVHDRDQRLRIVESSLDNRPGRVLLLEPGATEVVSYLVAPLPGKGIAMLRSDLPEKVLASVSALPTDRDGRDRLQEAAAQREQDFHIVGDVVLEARVPYRIRYKPVSTVLMSEDGSSVETWVSMNGYTHYDNAVFWASLDRGRPVILKQTTDLSRVYKTAPMEPFPAASVTATPTEIGWK